jgi:hypothetical protein
MKLAHYAALSLLLVGTAAAGQSNVSIGELRLPDAGFVDYANDGCRRLCPNHAWRSLPEPMRHPGPNVPAKLPKQVAVTMG